MNDMKMICPVCCFQLRFSKTERIEMFYIVNQQLKIDDKICCDSCGGRFFMKSNGALSCEHKGVIV